MNVFFYTRSSLYLSVVCNTIPASFIETFWLDDKAIQALVELVAETRRCSSNMKYVPQPTLMPTKSWFFKQALRPLKDWLQRGTATFETCKTGKYWQHKNIIETELQIGE